MHIVICSKHSLLANIAVNSLLSRLGDQKITLILANRPRREADAEPEFRQMRFLDEDIPRQVLFPLLDEQATIGRFASYGHLTSRFRCQVITIKEMSKLHLTATLQGLSPDLIISVVFGFLFRREDIALPRHGIINLHTGPLPEMPGLHAVFWSMYRRQAQATCTAHFVDTGVDSGPIIESRHMPLDYGRSLYDNLAACYEAGGGLLGDLATRIADGGVLSTMPQDPDARGRKLLYPGRAELDAFYAAGGSWVDEAAYVQRLTTDYLGSRFGVGGLASLGAMGQAV